MRLRFRFLGMTIDALENNTTARRIREVFFSFLLWREKHISEKNFVIVLAFIVGIFSGLAALVLKFLIHYISTVLTAGVNLESGNYLYILLPAVGVVITALYVRYVVRDDISHGVTRVLYAISQNKSRLKRHNVYTSVLASSVTIGFGGSVGAEGPIVYTGAAIGSNLGRVFRMSPRILMILVGCGAAAGIAGIFKAPIAGMLFTLEVLMLDLTAVSVMPLLIASITSTTIAYVYTGYEFEFFFAQTEDFYTSRIPYVIMLGVVSGLISLYFTRVMSMKTSSAVSATAGSRLSWAVAYCRCWCSSFRRSTAKVTAQSWACSAAILPLSSTARFSTTTAVRCGSSHYLLA